MKVIKRTTRTEKWCKKNISTVLGLAIVFCTMNGLRLGNEALGSIKQFGSHSFADNEMKVPTVILVGTQKGVSSAASTLKSS